MAPSREAFREQYFALSRSETLAFLAELYAAEGWQVSPGDKSLEIRRSKDELPRTVVVADKLTIDVSDVDTVVVASREADVDGLAENTVVDPSELYDRVRYAVDSETSDHLLDTHFGELSESRGANQSRSAGSTAFEARREHQGPVRSSGDETDQPMSGDGEVGTPPQNGGDIRTRRSLLIGAGTLFGVAGTVLTTHLVIGRTPVRAPGVSKDGIVEPATLAAAHASSIQDRSYSLVLDHVHRDDGLGLRSSLALDLALSTEREYLATVSIAGSDAPLVLGEPPATSIFWSNGEQYYVDHAPEESAGISAFTPPRGFVATWQYWAHLFVFGGVLGSSPESYYRDLFDAVPTRLADVREHAERTTYRLVSAESMPRSSLGHLAGNDVRAMELSTVIDDTGLIRQLSLRFRTTVDDTPSRVRRDIVYSSVGETDVTRPDWAT